MYSTAWGVPIGIRDMSSSPSTEAPTAPPSPMAMSQSEPCAREIDGAAAGAEIGSKRRQRATAHANPDRLGENNTIS